MASAITVAEVIELYLVDLRARRDVGDYSATGFSIASARLRRFAMRYGGKTIAECRQHDLSAWLTANPQFRSANCKKGVVATITACFNWALEEEVIDRAPYRRPRGLRGLENEVRRPASPQEYVALMSHRASRAIRRALYFLRKTGARTCEMRGLLWDQVFLDGAFPYIEMSNHKTRKKTGKPRRMGLDVSTARFLRNLRRQALAGWPTFDPPSAVDDRPRLCIRCDTEKPTSDFPMAKAGGKLYLRSWCKECFTSYHRARREAKRAGVRHSRPNRNAEGPDTQHVFLNCDGFPWDQHTFARHLRRLAERIGLDDGVEQRISGYCLRHLYAVDAIEAGVSIRKIADQLGHQSTAMIDKVYGSHTKHRIEHLSNVAAEIVRARNKMPPSNGDSKAKGGPS